VPTHQRTLEGETKDPREGARGVFNLLEVILWVTECEQDYRVSSKNRRPSMKVY
jgi:hypothetical protein